MAGSWSVEETRALIVIWGQEHVQSQLQTVHRNRDVYQRIAVELEENGYVKTWQQCRTKIKNLTQRSSYDISLRFSVKGQTKF